MNRPVAHEVSFPRLTLRVAHQLWKSSRAELSDARDDAAGRAQMEVRPVDGLTPSAERDATGVDMNPLRPERAQLALDERFESGRGDGEQVVAIGDGLSRRGSRLRRATARDTNRHRWNMASSEHRRLVLSSASAAFACDTRAAVPCECPGRAREARPDVRGGS